MPTVANIRPVNWGNSITRSMVFLVDCARARGNTLPRNIAGKLSNGTLKYGVGTISEAAGQAGPALVFPSSYDAAMRFGASTEFQGKEAFSAMWQGEFHVTSGNGAHQSLLGNGDPASTYQWMVVALKDVGSGGTQKFIFYPKSGASVTSAASYQYQTLYTVIGTYDGANARIYVNGWLDGTAAATGNSTGAGYIWINNGFYDGGPNKARCAAIWDRVLTPEEIRVLGNNPLRRLLRPATSLADLYVPAAGGGGSSAFNPAWARNSNVMIGVG